MATQPTPKATTEIETITPRFCETDALGHINNVSYAAWLEQGRMSYFMAHLDKDRNPFMMVKIEINYRNETFHGTDVEVHTHLARLGNSSLTLSQNIYQSGNHVVESATTLVNYDFTNKCSLPFNDEQRAQLSALMGN
ncbi:acyl-CoA thioesterase [Pseudomaricurvus sp.]|uniref:acyl-CoA thioesterase n=1 Tax=Pseudomaricurvus sp. TaxID=2004510 RepID=UPI003F6C7B06